MAIIVIKFRDGVGLKSTSASRPLMPEGNKSSVRIWQGKLIISRPVHRVVRFIQLRWKNSAWETGILVKLGRDQSWADPLHVCSQLSDLFPGPLLRHLQFINRPAECLFSADQLCTIHVTPRFQS